MYCTTVPLCLSRVETAQPYQGNHKRSRLRQQFSTGLCKTGLFFLQVYFFKAW